MCISLPHTKGCSGPSYVPPEQPMLSVIYLHEHADSLKAVIPHVRVFLICPEFVYHKQLQSWALMLCHGLGFQELGST